MMENSANEDPDMDDDDWFELEKTSATKAEFMPLAQVRISMVTRKNKTTAKAYLAFRREAAVWLLERGPRYRIQIGGSAAQKIRITPDLQRGKLILAELKGCARLQLGFVSAWPAQVREATACDMKIGADNVMILTLPISFVTAAKAGQVSNVDHAESTQAQSALIGKPSTPAQGIGLLTSVPDPGSTMRRVIDRRPDNGAVHLGEPMPGRSALDQRREAERQAALDALTAHKNPGKK